MNEKQTKIAENTNLKRETKQIESELTLSQKAQKMLRLWCDSNSPYSCKLRTYLNYKDIPYQRMRINLNAYMKVIPDLVGMSIMPVVLTHNDDVLQDTTPIMALFEQEYPEKACIPDDPKLAFIMWLLEDFGDEYLTRFSMHNRWGNSLNRSTLSHRLGRSMSYGNVSLHASNVAPMILARQAGFDGPLGLTSDEIRHDLDSQLIELLGLFESHFCNHQFLLGDKPSLADFAVYGHFQAHLYQDPSSAQIMEKYGSRSCNWLDTITELGDVRGLAGQTIFGDWIKLDNKVPDTLKAILAFVAKTYIPFASGAALATHEKQKDYCANINGINTQFMTFQYRAWSFENVQNQFNDLTPIDKDFIQTLLIETQVQPQMMANGVLHCTLFDGFTPPLIKNATADARIAYLKLKAEKKAEKKAQEKALKKASLKQSSGQNKQEMDDASS
jgi:glutathione S-transferase